jgi:hypothetical protein
VSELTTFRDHARARADWQPGTARAACRERTAFGTSKPADHANCGGGDCGCACHQPTDRERAMWKALADEIDDYLSADDEGAGLFDLAEGDA